jgi:L-fuculose-phosphate aldolase
MVVSESLGIASRAAAELQLLCESVGEVKPIEPALGKQAHDWILQERRSQATFHYYARQLLRSQRGTDQNPLL